jgi:hypothetical protein
MTKGSGFSSLRVQETFPYVTASRSELGLSQPLSRYIHLPAGVLYDELSVMRAFAGQRVTGELVPLLE